MDFIYDNNGQPYAVKYDGTTYYYILNLQGDVISIVTYYGMTVALYYYDAWGKNIGTWCATNYPVGSLNPLRYRGYYYDKESGLYYLQSRYYDPVVKRFINADKYASTGQGFTGFNMFAYSLNNPVRYSDCTGSVALIDDLIVIGVIGIGCLLIYAEVTFSPAGRAAQEDLASSISSGLGSLEKYIGGVWQDLQNNISNASSDAVREAVEISYARSTPRNYRNKTELHHIVARSARAARPAQRILTNLGIDYRRNPVNLVPLRTSLHRRLHTNVYYSWVNQRIISAYNRNSSRKANVVAELNRIRAFLYALSTAAPW